MKIFLSFLLLTALAAFAAADDEVRADPDIFDGSFAAASGGGADEQNAAEPGGEVDPAGGGAAGDETEDGANDGEASGNGDADDTAASGTGESGEDPPSSGTGQTESADGERPARGDMDLGDLPEVGEVRIGGTGGIERPVEPERVEIPRVDMPRVPVERRTEPAETAEETPEESSDDARRVDRGDEHQPRNEPVRRVGEGSTVPTDF